MVSVATALLALVMLSFASVQSIVMQTILSGPEDMAPDCAGRDDTGMAEPGMMSGMVMDGAHARAIHHRRPQTGQDHKAACPYCEAAAHLPVVGQAPFPQRIGITVFAAFHVIAMQGPRGPPALQLHARGPPTGFPTA